MRKRILSWVMTFAMVVSLMPAVVWAEEGGCNHVHDAECGYTAAVAGSPCSHEHDAACYKEVTACLHECTEDCYALHCEEDHEHSAECYESICKHECSIESGCIKEVLDCKHVHDADCGYVAAQEGTPCNHVHDADCGGLQTDDEPEEENIPMAMNLDDLSSLTGDVVYVGGAPDNVEKSYSTLTDAIHALPEAGGTVVIYSDISQGKLGDTVLSKPVTIVGYGDAVLTVTDTWTLGADLTFRDINIAVDNKTIYANGRTLTFGEGVVMVTENMTAPGFTLYGGYTANNDVEKTNIIIQSGLFRTVAGGGSTGAVKGDTNVEVSGGIITTLYGGGYNVGSAVSGDVNIEITGGSIGTVYGANNSSVTGAINIDIQDAAITTVYGGSAGASTVVGGDITIKVTDANVKSLYGGGYNATAVTTGDVTITIENSELANVYGGGNSGTVNGTAAITVDGSTITNLYGSGYTGKVNNAKITVNSGNITNIYSARGSVGIDDAEEDGGTVAITVNGGTITYLYAGASLGDQPGQPGQTVAALSQTNITGGKITSIYLGTAGNIGVQGKTENTTVAELEISGGKITNVYAGPSSSGSIYGNVDINLSGDGTITTLYGSGGNASGTVNGDVTITATEEAFANVTTYKEQANGKRTGSVILKITDGDTPEVDETAKITGAGTEESPYIIKTDAQFYALGWALSGDPVVMAQGLAYFPEGVTAESIRTASYALGGSFTIKSGPTFGSMPDFFVGVGTTNYPFAGTFDGKKDEGYEITVQYDYTRNNIADEGNQYVGLFSVANGATIQNLKISDDSIYTLEQQVGVNLYGSMLLANAAGNCEITNCEVGGTVEIDFGERFFHNIRFGFISGNFRGTIDHCEVTEGSTLTIHCAPTSSTNGMARGVGIAFCAAAATIKNSTSYADITVDVGTAAAIAFNHSTSDAKNITVENCVNYGALTADSGSVYAIASPEATIKDSSHMLKVNSGTAWKLDGKALAVANGYIAIPVSSGANNSYDNAASLTDGSGVSYLFAADGNIYNTPHAGSGYTGENPFTENNPLIISSQADYMEVKRALAGSKEDLAAIFAGTAASSASAAEQKGLLAQAYLQIGNDFTITSSTAIGLGSTATPFAGTLDGNNKTVTLEINMEGSNCAGSSFVGILDSNASGEIKNLNLAGNIQIKDTTLNMNYAYVSALCQNVPADYTVSNCNSSVNINYDNTGYTVNTSAMSKTLYLNGMAYEVYGTMTNCINSGNITIKETTGNVYSTMTAGCAYKLYDSGTLENFTMSGDISVTTTETKSNSVYVGGVLVTTAAGLTNCTHSGAITVDSATTSVMPIGGIVANNTLADGLAFKECVNNGAITVTSKNAGIYVGGIIAQNTKTVTIENGKNTGALTGKSMKGYVYIGGLIGQGGSVASTLKNCENTGNITAESATVSYAGGIVGYGKIAAATGGSNSGGISVVGNTISYVGGLVGNLTFAGADSSISDFTNEGEISVDCKGVDYVGGVVGYAATRGTLEQAANSGKVSVSGQNSDIFVGGILGSASNVGVEGCANTGAIQSQLTNSNSFVGGISGRITSSQVLDSINTGSVTANYTGFRGNTVYIGGIVGQVVNATGCAIERTVSQGQVYGTSNGTGPIYAGGIMGVNSCTEANAWELKQNISVAPITISHTGTGASYTGGIVGYGQYNNSIKADSNYFSADLCGVDNANGFARTGDYGTGVKLVTPLTVKDSASIYQIGTYDSAKQNVLTYSNAGSGNQIEGLVFAADTETTYSTIADGVATPSGKESGVDHYTAAMTQSFTTAPKGYEDTASYAVPFGTAQVLVNAEDTESNVASIAVTRDNETAENSYEMTAGFSTCEEEDHIHQLTLTAEAKADGDNELSAPEKVVTWKFYSDSICEKALTNAALAAYGTFTTKTTENGGSALTIDANKSLTVVHTIYARAESVVNDTATSDVVQITITPDTPTGITVTLPDEITGSGTEDAPYQVSAGTTLALNAVLEPACVGQAVSWSSHALAVATVSQNGIVSTLKDGTVTITVTSNSYPAFSKDIYIQVEQAVSGLSISLPEELNSGETDAATATITYYGGETKSASSDDIRWSSSDETVVTISADGIITVVGAGSAVITATSKENSAISASAPLTVYQSVENVAISPAANQTMYVGDSLQLTAAVTPANASNTGVRWVSSDTNVARVSSSGLVHGTGVGTAVITATSVDNEDATAGITVTVTARNGSVKSMSITDGDIIGTEETFTVTFSEAMKGVVSVALNGAGTGTAVWSNDGKTLTVTLSGLTSGTDYKIALNGIRYSNDMVFDPIAISCATAAMANNEAELTITGDGTLIDGNASATPDKITVNYTTTIPTAQENALVNGTVAPSGYRTTGDFFGLFLQVDGVAAAADTTLNREISVTIPYNVARRTYYKVACLNDNGTIVIKDAIVDYTGQTLTVSLDNFGQRLMVLSKKYSSSSSGSSSKTYYTIQAEASAGGKISSSGSYSVVKNGSKTYHITPNEGYVIEDVIVDGKSVGAVSSYTFSNVTKTHTIKAIFMKETELPAETAYAEEAAIILTINEKEASVFGEKVMNDVPPIIRNDRTMLPIRFVAEALGASVGWNDVMKKVTITKDDLLIEITIGSPIAYVNNMAVVLDSPAFIENDRTYLPIRFVAENLGATVLWDGETQKVIIIPEIETE